VAFSRHAEIFPGPRVLRELSSTFHPLLLLTLATALQLQSFITSCPSRPPPHFLPYCEYVVKLLSSIHAGVFTILFQTPSQAEKQKSNAFPALYWGVHACLHGLSRSEESREGFYFSCRWIVVRVPELVGGGYLRRFSYEIHLTSLDLPFPVAGPEHLFVSPCNTNPVMVWVGRWRAVTEGHGWVAAAACSTQAPWRSEQLWPYHSLMSLNAWILHSGHAKSLHLVHHPKILWKFSFNPGGSSPHNFWTPRVKPNKN